MPWVAVRLPPAERAAIAAEVTALRKAHPDARRATLGSHLARIVRAYLKARRLARRRALVEALRSYPVKGRRLPDSLQDRTLAAIAHGAVDLIPHLLRAGSWDRQVATLAHRWSQPGLSHEELCAAGMVGLLRAVRDWRPGPGWRSYAYTWIKKELERACRTSGAIVLETEQEMRVRRIVEKHVRRGLTDSAAIATASGLSVAQVEQGLRGRRALDWKELE